MQTDHRPDIFHPPGEGHRGPLVVNRARADLDQAEGELDPSALAAEVAGRLGVLPNFFRSNNAAPEVVQHLWAFAKSGYLDNPLPPLFKERLFVHLSRFCSVRYCIVRHTGFLLGRGRPAGDASAPAHSVEQVVALLRRKGRNWMPRWPGWRKSHNLVCLT